MQLHNFTSESSELLKYICLHEFLFYTYLYHLYIFFLLFTGLLLTNLELLVDSCFLSCSLI